MNLRPLDYAALVVSLACLLVAAVPGAGATPADRQSSQAAASHDAAEWSTITIPGTEEELLGIVGLPPGMPRSRIVPALIRAAHTASRGHDRAADLAASRLAAYFGKVIPGGPSVRVPLPLAPIDWVDRLVDTRGGAVPLGEAILRDRQASWLYLALSSMDPESARRLVDSVPADVLRREAAVLVVAARSLVLRGDGVHPPGGAVAVPLWETLVGVRVADPARFVATLLDRDEGLLAYFYDSVAVLDPPRQWFALHLATTGDDRRIDRLRALYGSFARCEPSWTPREQPLSRPPFDGAMLLALVETAGTGLAAGSEPPALWVSVFRPGDNPAVALSDKGDPTGVDAALLASLVLVRAAPTERQERLETLLFGQRVFPLAGSRDWRPLVPILRGYWRHRSLMLVLERIGVRDPDAYRAALGTAERLGRIARPEDRAVALAQFQGLLGVIDRLADSGAIDRAVARSLAASAAALEPGLNGRYDGRVAQWAESVLAPALAGSAPGAPTPSGAADRIVRALAGPPGPPQTEPITWEGERYRVDLRAAASNSLAATLARMGGPTLAQALEFASVTRTLLHDPVSVENARAQAARLADVAAGIGSVAPPSRRPIRAEAVTSAVASAVERVGRLSRDGDLRQLLAEAESLFPIADALVAESLAGLAYASCIGDPASPVLEPGSPVSSHDFGFATARNPEQGARAPWELPREVRGEGGPWHLAGSLLALDYALADLRLRRVSTEPPPRPPRINDNDRRTFVLSLAAFQPTAIDEATPAAIAEGLRRGHARIERVRADAAAAATIAREAGAETWRINAIRWSAGEEPDAVDSLFTLTDQLRLGDPSLDAARMSSWGTSALARGGGLTTRYPGPASSIGLPGRPALGLAATRVPDLHLRATAELAVRGLPGTLAPSVVAFALQDYLDEVQPSDADDWLSLAAYAQEITPVRFDDYIAALTARGPLVPVTREK